MNHESHQAVAMCIATLISCDVRRATKYLSPKEVVVAHRIVPGGKPDPRDKEFHFRVKVGAPNIHERAFIKDCKAAGEPFPVKKIQTALFRKVRKRTARQTKRFGEIWT